MLDYLTKLREMLGYKLELILVAGLEALVNPFCIYKNIVLQLQRL